MLTELPTIKVIYSPKTAYRMEQIMKTQTADNQAGLDLRCSRVADQPVVLCRDITLIIMTGKGSY